MVETAMPVAVKEKNLARELKERLKAEFKGRLTLAEVEPLKERSRGLRLTLAVRRANRELLAELYDQVYRVLLTRNFPCSVSLLLPAKGELSPSLSPGNWLGWSRQSLQAARYLMQEGFYMEAASRLFYSVYYASLALLAGEEVAAEGQEKVFLELGRRLVATGRLDPYYHKIYLKAADFRERGEERPDETLLLSELEASWGEAQNFLREASRILEETVEEALTGSERQSDWAG